MGVGHALNFALQTIAHGVGSCKKSAKRPVLIQPLATVSASTRSAQALALSAGLRSKVDGG